MKNQTDSTSKPFSLFPEREEKGQGLAVSGYHLALHRISTYLEPFLQRIGYDFELRMAKSTAYRVKPVSKWKEWTTTEARFAAISDEKGAGLLGKVFLRDNPTHQIRVFPLIREGGTPVLQFTLTKEIKELPTEVRVAAMLRVLSAFDTQCLILLINNGGGIGKPYNVKAPQFCLLHFNQTVASDWGLTYRNVKTRKLDRMYLKNTDLLLRKFYSLEDFKLILDNAH